MKTILNILECTDYFIKRIEEFLACYLFLFVVISVIAQIILRYIFNSPLTWVEEVGSFLIIWITMLGGSILYKDNKHVKIDFLLAKLSRKVTTIINILINLIIFITLFFIAKAGLRLIPAQYDISCTATLTLTKSYYTLPLVIVSISMMISAIKKILITSNTIKQLS